MKVKVKCEYCQSMVDAGERYCPSCGSPLPEVKPQAGAEAPVSAAARRRGYAVLLLFLLALMGAAWLTLSLLGAGTGRRKSAERCLGANPGGPHGCRGL